MTGQWIVMLRSEILFHGKVYVSPIGICGGLSIMPSGAIPLITRRGANVQVLERRDDVWADLDSNTSGHSNADIYHRRFLRWNFNRNGVGQQPRITANQYMQRLRSRERQRPHIIR